MEALSQYLAMTGKTQAAFAAEVNVTQPTVNRWIRGAAVPALATASRIERVTAGAVPVSAWLGENSEDAA